MTLFAGTSGFGFRQWVGGFYPKGTKPAAFLAHYASVFRTVEINYTFRRFPTAAVIRRWRDATPDGFRFAVKANQRITHRARLGGAGDLVADFLGALEPLGERLGPVLFQCPPWFRRDDERLKGFLEALPEDGRFAFEFRHPSWQCREVRSICRGAGAALAGAFGDLDEEIEAPATAPFAYVRLRRDPPYDESEQSRIAAMLDGLRGRVGETWLYVKHDGPGLAPAAVEWIQGLEAPTARSHGTPTSRSHGTPTSRSHGTPTSRSA